MSTLLTIVAVLAAFLAFGLLVVSGHPLASAIFRITLGDAGDDDQPGSVKIRAKIDEAVERYRDLKAKPERDRGDTWAADVQMARNDVVDLDHDYDRALKDEKVAFERAMWEAAVEQAAKGPQSRGGTATHDDVTGEGRRSVGEVAVLSDAYTEWAENGANGGRRMPELTVEGRSLLSPQMRALVDSSVDNSGSDAGLFIPTGQPIAPTPRQMRFFLRDVLSVQQTTLAAIPYIRELNPATLETGASFTWEAGPKAEVALDFEDDTAVVKKITAWLPVTMEVLADAPTLRGYIDTRLIYMLKVRETQQILKGAGTGAQLPGIMTFSGVQTVANESEGQVDGDVPATVAAGLGKIENVDGDGNGLAMNPLDYWGQMATRHANQFDGQANSPGGAPFQATPGVMWDVPVIRTRALAQTEAIVADWAQGATLFDRMQNTIRQSDSHDDYFVHNKVAILAEERVALAVHRPDFFVVLTLDLSA